MTWADLGIIAIFIAGVMSLTRSKLSLFVFAYLIGILLIQTISSELHPEGKLKLFPTVPIIIIFQYFMLYSLDKSHIRARIVPLVIGLAMFFEAVCITEDMFGQRYFVLYYGMVLGVTSLLASLEGGYFGINGILSKALVGDRRVTFRFSWLSEGLAVIKKERGL